MPYVRSRTQQQHGEARVLVLLQEVSQRVQGSELSAMLDWYMTIVAHSVSLELSLTLLD